MKKIKNIIEFIDTKSMEYYDQLSDLVDGIKRRLNLPNDNRVEIEKISKRLKIIEQNVFDSKEKEPEFPIKRLSVINESDETNLVKKDDWVKLDKNV